ncbi:MAG: hypothetical protein P8R42_28795 [Candidatus Binatia bacterium]|nr:hypothetical protein [Candidatus Binatia bacterium]
MPVGQIAFDVVVYLFVFLVYGWLSFVVVVAAVLWRRAEPVPES